MSVTQQLDAISLQPRMRTKVQNHLSRLGYAQELHVLELPQAHA
ncbi:MULTISPECIES: hypothetical protein [Pseudomonas]|nr:MULTISPECIES: hypothetical protein [Pseudomonas]UXV22642.1 hypothetical protein N4P55_23280 [Pseudomonas fluorescens]